MIQAIGLTSVPRRHRPPAVDDLTFEACPEQITVLWGPAGAGKTTALRLMLHLSPGRGAALFRGRPLPRVPQPFQEVGVLLGDVPGHPARTARNHLRMLAAAVGVPVDRVDDLLDTVGLADVADHRLGGFSLGMSRRLALAAALLGDPHTLVLDEPTLGLSPRELSWVARLLAAYAAGGGTVLVATREIAVVRELADRVVTIEAGRLRADEEVTDFLRARGRRRVTVHSPEADRLATLLSSQAGVSSRPGASVPLEVVAEGGGRIAVYGSTCATIGETAHRHGILVHQLTPEGGHKGPDATTDSVELGEGGWVDPASGAGITDESSVDSLMRTPGVDRAPSTPVSEAAESGTPGRGAAFLGAACQGSLLVAPEDPAGQKVQPEDGGQSSELLTASHPMDIEVEERAAEASVSQEARSEERQQPTEASATGAGGDPADRVRRSATERSEPEESHLATAHDAELVEVDTVIAAAEVGNVSEVRSTVAGPRRTVRDDPVHRGVHPSRPGSPSGAEPVEPGAVKAAMSGADSDPGAGRADDRDVGRHLGRPEVPAVGESAGSTAPDHIPEREEGAAPHHSEEDRGVTQREKEARQTLVVSEVGVDEAARRHIGSPRPADVEAREVVDRSRSELSALLSVSGHVGPLDQRPTAHRPHRSHQGTCADPAPAVIPGPTPTAAVDAAAGATSGGPPTAGGLLCSSGGALVIRSAEASPAQEAGGGAAASFRIPTVRPPAPNHPWRYELLRFATLRSSWFTPLVALLAGLGTAVILARSGGTAVDRLLSGWPVSLPLPPVALAAGALGAVAFGQEFRYPVLAPAQASFPRRLGLLVAKLTLSGVLAVALVLSTVAVNISVGVLLTGDRAEVLHPPSGLLASVLGLVVLCLGCAWGGLLTAGAFRSTAAGLVAVVVVPMVGAPALWALLSGTSATGIPAWLWADGLVSGLSGFGPWWSGVREFCGQPVGCAALLTLVVLLGCSTYLAHRGRTR